MKDFSIQLQGGSLDVYDQDIGMSWTPIRFSDGLSDAFSTDITIPKTENNMRLLEVSGLLDSSAQLFGDKIVPSVLMLAGEPVDTALQVVEITEDDIKVCLYERTLPPEVTDRKLNEFFTDDNSTIWPWCPDTMNHNTGEFRPYHYGMGYDARYAQYHPSKPLSELMAWVNSQLQGNQQLPLPWNADGLYAVATNKYVCPQNEIQVLEFNDTDMDNGFFNLHGGQHVANDLEFGSSSDRVTFNRPCSVTATIRVVWFRKPGAGNRNLYVSRNSLDVMTCTVPSASVEFGSSVYHWSGVFSEGDYLRFRMPDTGKYSSFSVVVRLNVHGYDIYDDDYGTELKYVWRLPRWRVKSTQSWGGAEYYIPSDGNHHNLLPGSYMQTSYLSFAYFGYYCNLPEITIKELLFGICWLNGQKIVRGSNSAVFADATDNAVLDDVYIEALRPSPDVLGQHNFLRFTGQEEGGVVSEIANTWLEKTKTLHESPFAYATSWGSTASLPQYSNPEKETDDDGNVTGYSCDFEEVDGFTMCGKNTAENLKPLTINKMGLNELKSAMEADIVTRDAGVKDMDFVYVNGRKFMVVEGDRDMAEGITKLRCLLVPGQTYNIIPVTPPK